MQRDELALRASLMRAQSASKTPPFATSDEVGAVRHDTWNLPAVHAAAPLVIAFVAYFLAGKLGQATTSIRSSNLGPVWPAYGVALAAFLTYGYRVWPAIVISAFVVAVQGSVSAAAAAGQAVGATFAAMTGAFLLRRIPDFQPTLPRLRDALGLIFVGAFGSALISSVLGTLSLYATGVQAYAGLFSSWLIYWLGDSTGVLLITPLVFTIPQLQFPSTRRVVEFVALLTLLCGACFVLFGDAPMFPIRLPFAVFPFVLWGAIRFGIAGVTLSVLATAGIATVLTALGYGPFVGNTTFAEAVILDVLFIGLSLPGLVIAAVISERRQAERDRERLIREQAGMEARLHLAAIVESSEDAIWSQDLNGTIRSWNAAAERMFGYTAEEIIGRPVSMLLPANVRDEDRNTLEELRAGDRIIHRETTRRTKSDVLVHVSLTVSAMRDGAGALVGVAKIARDTSEQRKAREALSVVNRKLIEAQEAERSRIARELHDDICQRLALLSFDLSSDTPATTEDKERLRRRVADIATDVQALSHNLHAAKLDLLGLAAGCKRFCDEFAEKQKVTVRFEARDVPRRVPSDVSLCLYRILQEALHNAAKHSGGANFDVQLSGGRDVLELVVKDHGVGFDVNRAKLVPGIGLVSMQERVNLVGGDLAIESAPHKGASIHVRVPLPHPSANG